MLFYDEPFYYYLQSMTLEMGVHINILRIQFQGVFCLS